MYHSALLGCSLTHLAHLSPVLYFLQVQQTAILSSSASTLPLSFHTSHLNKKIDACILHPRMLSSPDSLYCVCAVGLVPQEAACRKRRALDLTVHLVSSFDKNNSKLCARILMADVFLQCCCIE